MSIRTRFAPTPSGLLHWGNAFSFVVTWLIARKSKGSILLRIDDLDATRKRPEFVEDIFRSLDWLGLDYDVGPSGPDDFESNFSQALRLDLYREHLRSLRDTQQVFGCACSRASIQRESKDGLHPPDCRDQQIELTTEAITWRVKTTDEPLEWEDHDGRRQSVNLHAVMRDFVVRRKDGIPAYQLASIVDDDYFGTNFLVRGDDLLASTAAQLWLSRRMKVDHFANASFVHHRIVAGEDGSKLSKSAGAVSLQSLRKQESTPEKLYQRLSPMLALQEPVTSAVEALASWQGLSRVS